MGGVWAYLPPLGCKTKNIDFNNCQTRGKAEDRKGVQTLTEIYSLHKI